MPSSHESDAGMPRDDAAVGVSSPEPGHADEHARVEELAGELERLEDRYRRARADLDNYRKRSAREVDRRVAEARESLLRDWLEAVDSVERALRMDPDN